MKKTCTKCGEEKQLEGFYKHHQGRLGRDSKCIPCANAVNTASYHKYREKRRLQANAHRKANPEKIKAQKRKEYERNYWKRAEKLAAYSKMWREENKDYIRSRERKRYREQEKYKLANAIKAARRRASMVLWADESKIAEIYAEARFLTKVTGIKHVVDHLIPIKHPLVCGLHVENNLRVVTERENAVKKNKFEPVSLGVV